MPGEDALSAHVRAGLVYLAAIAACAALMIGGGLLAGHETAFNYLKLAGMLLPVCFIGVALRVGNLVLHARLSDPGWVTWLLLALACLAVLPGMAVAAYFGPWYQSHHGRSSAAIVAGRRCLQDESGGCLVELRLTNVATGQHLGWFSGCDRFDRGQRVTLKGSRSDWLAPVIRECAAGAATVFPAAADSTGVLAGTIILFRIGSSAQQLRSRRRAQAEQGFI